MNKENTFMPQRSYRRAIIRREKLEINLCLLHIYLYCFKQFHMTEYRKSTPRG